MTTEPANTPLPRKRRLWRWLLLAVGLLVLFPIAVVYSLNWYGERRFQAELDKIRDRGEPVDAADLDALRKHPDLDLTDIYLGASKGFGSRACFDDHDDDIDDFEVVPIVGYLEPWPLPGEKWAKIEVSEKFLKRARGQLIMIHDAVSRNGDAWIQLNFRDGVGMDSQHQIYLRSAVKWLALEAWYHAFRGKNSDAAQSIHAGFRITNIFANEPFALSVLIRRALHELILNAIKSLLTSVAWQDSELSRFQEDIRASMDGEELYRALLGERVLIIETFRNPTGLTSGGDSALRKLLVQLGMNSHSGSPRDASTPLLWTYNNCGNFADYCELLARAIKVAKCPWGVAHAEAMAIDQAIRDRAWDRGASWENLRIENFYGPHFDAVVTSYTTSIAHQRLADAAIGAELYRRKHGTLPEKVEQLVPEFLPEVPLDPFDGQPIRYVVREDKYVFYSVGPDGKDDGAPGPPADDPHGDGPDIEFAVKRKAG